LENRKHNSTPELPQAVFLNLSGTWVRNKLGKINPAEPPISGPLRERRVILRAKFLDYNELSWPKVIYGRLDASPLLKDR
jgi:hypothetical protein